MNTIISATFTLLLAVSLSAEPEVKINRPNPPSKAFKITLTNAAEIMVGGVVLSREQLAGVLTALADGVEAPSVLLEGQPEVSHAQVQNLHQLLLDSGIGKEKIFIGLTSLTPESKKAESGPRD